METASRMTLVFIWKELEIGPVNIFLIFDVNETK